VSQQNVEIVKRFIGAAGSDLIALHGNGDVWARFVEEAGGLLEPDFESVVPELPGTRVYVGLDEFHQAWLDWLVPWERYGVEVVEIVDHGARVFVLIANVGRLAGTSHNVETTFANIYRIRDGRIMRWEAYLDRTAAQAAQLGRVDGVAGRCARRLGTPAEGRAHEEPETSAKPESSLSGSPTRRVA
jgi:ketosteroid isomerase-like protein